MSQTKKRVLIILSTILFILLYIVFAFRFSGDELQLNPKWTISATRATTVENSDVESFPFKLGQNLGYFTESGEVTFSESFPYMATISKNNWSIFSSSAENFPIYNKEQSEVGTVVAAGFPFYTDYGNFLFLPGGMSFAYLSSTGEVLWTYEDVTPITSFYPYENGVIVGYVEGKIINFDFNGNIIFTATPGGSNYSVILGVAASNDGALSACVSGIDNQRFVLMKTSNGQTKIIFHEFLSGNLREQTFVKFSKDNSKVFYNEKNGLGAVDITTLKSSHISIEGKILAIEEMPDDNLFFVLTKADGVYRVYIIEDLDNLVGSYVFKGNSAFIFVDKNNLYTGVDSTITKIEVQRWKWQIKNFLH